MMLLVLLFISASAFTMDKDMEDFFDPEIPLESHDAIKAEADKWTHDQIHEMGEAVSKAIHETRAEWLETHAEAHAHLSASAKSKKFYSALMACDRCENDDGTHTTLLGKSSKKSILMKIERVYALEWVLGPVPSPFFNPMMTFGCNPEPALLTEMGFEDKLPEGFNPFDETPPVEATQETGLLAKVAKKLSEMPRKFVQAMKSLKAMIPKILITTIRCVTCVMCNIMRKIIAFVQYAIKKLGQAKAAMGKALKAAGHSIANGASKAYHAVGAAASKAKNALGHLHMPHLKKKSLLELAPASLLETKAQAHRALHKYLLSNNAHVDPEGFVMEHSHAIMSHALTGTLSFFQMASSAHLHENAAVRDHLTSRVGGWTLPNNCVTDVEMGKTIGLAINIENPKIMEFLISGGMAVSELIPEVLVAIVPFRTAAGFMNEHCLITKANEKAAGMDLETDLEADVDKEIQDFTTAAATNEGDIDHEATNTI